MGLDSSESEFCKKVYDFFQKRIEEMYPLDPSPTDPLQIQKEAHEVKKIEMYPLRPKSYWPLTNTERSTWGKKIEMYPLDPSPTDPLQIQKEAHEVRK